MYDFADKRLGQNKSFVRLRAKGDKAELVFKKRLPDETAKSYEELEVEVSDLETARAILENIGLVETERGRRKHRISYSLENAHFELDEFEGIPAFLEIEVSQSDELPRWVDLLGYAMDDAKPWSGKDVFEHYGLEYS